MHQHLQCSTRIRYSNPSAEDEGWQDAHNSQSPQRLTKRLYVETLTCVTPRLGNIRWDQRGQQHCATKGRTAVARTSLPIYHPSHPNGASNTFKTLCPSGLRGWTQFPLARAAWVQIPQVSFAILTILYSLRPNRYARL